MDAIATILLLTALATIIYGPWQDYCTDAARQTLFEIRDELFDMARAGKLSFDSAEYRTIRRSFEQNIRFAHQLTIWRFFLLFVHLRMHTKELPKSELTLAIENISDPQVRREIRALSMRSFIANVQMMFLKAPLFIVIVAFGTLIQKTGRSFGKLRDHVSDLTRSAGEAIQIEAEVAGACP